MAQSAQFPLPPDAMQFAAINYLGTPLAIYKYRSTFAMIAALFLVLFGIFFLALLLLDFTSPPTDGSGTQLAITFTLLALALLALGVWLFIRAHRDRGSHVYVFTEGLLRPNENKAIALRWDQVEAVWQSVTKRYYNGVYTGTSHQYTLRLLDGTKVVFNDRIQNVEALGNTIAKETLRVLLPRVITAYNVGSTITFGPLSISYQGMSNGRETLAWNGIKGIQVNRGIVTVKKEGKWLNWSTVSVPRIPNFFVFIALVNYVTDLQK